jgi:hypothetical protein
MCSSVIEGEDERHRPSIQVQSWEMQQLLLALVSTTKDEKRRVYTMDSSGTRKTITLTHLLLFQASAGSEVNVQLRQRFWQYAGCSDLQNASLSVTSVEKWWNYDWQSKPECLDKNNQEVLQFFFLSYKTHNTCVKSVNPLMIFTETITICVWPSVFW